MRAKPASREYILEHIKRKKGKKTIENLTIAVLDCLKITKSPIKIWY